MAVNTKLKRDAVKYIRDGIKSNYKKDSICAICGEDDSLELHHYNSVSLLVKNYAAKNHLDFSDESVILDSREQLYKEHWFELVEDTVTLCNMHHSLLHKVYGKEPPLYTATKQKNWVTIQCDKLNNPTERTVTSSGFGKFLR